MVACAEAKQGGGKALFVSKPNSRYLLLRVGNRPQITLTPPHLLLHAPKIRQLYPMFGVYSQLERRVFDPRSSRPTALMTRQLRLVASVIFLVTLFFLFYQESPRLQYRKISLTHPSLSLSLKEAVTGPDQGAKVLSPPESGGRGANAAEPFIYRSENEEVSRVLQDGVPVETEKADNEQRSTNQQAPLIEQKEVETKTETADAAVKTSPTGDRYWGADIDWSQFAYTQYVTDGQYLCNAVMIFEALNRLGSRPDRLLLYPSYMLHDPSIASNDDLEGEAMLLLQARDEYDVKLTPIEVAHRETYDGRPPLTPIRFQTV
jgi:hypothetical protein